MSNKFLEHKGYKGSVDFNLNDEVLHGRILFIRDVISYEADDIAGLRASFCEAVDEYLEDCREDGVEPERPFSGTLQIRLGPDLHEYSALQAINKGVSLNEYIKQLVIQDKQRKPAEREIFEAPMTKNFQINFSVHVPELKKGDTPKHVWTAPVRPQLKVVR